MTASENPSQAGGFHSGAEAILQANIELQAISDDLPALISYVDREYRYRMCNRAYTSWFGLSRDQVLGRTLCEVLGERVWQGIRPHMDAALGGATEEFELEADYRLGGRRWIHVTYTPHRGASGSIEGAVVLVTDVTARHDAERQLRESEERFRAFVTTSSQVVYRMSADWTELRELVGRDFIPDTPHPTREWLQKYIHPADQDRVTAAVDRAIRARTPFELEHRVLRVDGTSGWAHSRAIPMYDANGNIAEWFGAASDITAQRRHQQSFLESEERYRTLFNSIDEGFCVIEVIFDEKQRPVDYRFLEVNPAFEKQAGMHGATGRRMLEFVSHIEPHWLENYGRVAVTGEPIRFADEYKSLGSWFDVYAFRVGEPEGRKVAVLFNNITQRKAAEDAIRESEERFRNMSNHSPVMLWVTDADGECTHLNDRWFDFTGQTAANGLGKGWLDAVHPDDREASKRAFLAANSEGQALRLEYRLRRHDGTYRWALDTASPRYSRSGAFLGYIGSVLDIHDRKEMEDTLREAKEKAEQASRAKDTFLAQLSHELRTPLTPVLMTAAVLREDETLPSSVREQLQMIERNVGLEARLIDDLLDLTRVTRGKLTLRPELCDAHSLLLHVLDMVREEAREKQIEMKVELRAARALLNGDPTRLQQVFWNILRNALKFTGVGGRIRVHSHNAASPHVSQPQLHIAVSDDGIGFAPDLSERLFSAFERGVTDDQRFPGLGLGLAITRAIVDLHEGKIEAVSQGPNQGATFTVCLPVLDLLAPVPAAAPATANDGEPEPQPPMRLLVVEDHEPTLRVLTRMLSRAGHEIETASTIASALELAAQRPFDAVVSDLGLPDGSGVELMTQLRAQHGLCGIALSGYGMEEDVRRSAEAGFAAHLVKPVELNELRRALRNLHQALKKNSPLN